MNFTSETDKVVFNSTPQDNVFNTTVTMNTVFISDHDRSFKPEVLSPRMGEESQNMNTVFTTTPEEPHRSPTSGVTIAPTGLHRNRISGATTALNEPHRSPTSGATTAPTEPHRSPTSGVTIAPNGPHRSPISGATTAPNEPHRSPISGATSSLTEPHRSPISGATTALTETHRCQTSRATTALTEPHRSPINRATTALNEPLRSPTSGATTKLAEQQKPAKITDSDHQTEEGTHFEFSSTENCMPDLNAVPPYQPATGPQATAKTLNCFYTNADSLHNKHDELAQYLKEMETAPDIIAITEVKAKNQRLHLTQAELQLENYELHTKNLETREGRGVAIYLHNSLSGTVFQPAADGSEQLWVKIRLHGGDSLALGCIYRSPNSTAENDRHLNETLRAVAEMGFSHLLICGDFNYPHINWTDWTVNVGDPRSHAFIDALQDCYLYQHSLRPTRSRGNDRPSTIDLILTNEEQMVDGLELGAPLGLSDHCTMTFRFHCYAAQQQSRTRRRNYRRGNFTSMRAELALVDWQEVFEQCADDPNKQYEKFKAILLEAEKHHIPLMNEKSRDQKHKYPLDAKIRAEIRKKHRLWQRYMEDRVPDKLARFKKQRNMVRKLVRAGKRAFETQLATKVKDQPKAFWRYAKSKLRVSEGISDLNVEGQIDADGKQKMATTDKEKAETLSDYFHTVYTTEAEGPVPSRGEWEGEPITSDEPITRETVRKMLKELNTSKSPGPDGVHPQVLQEMHEVLDEPLQTIFNTSLRTGRLPVCWKEANISAIFKKGKKKQPSNYRPVSLTCIPCKMLEKILRQRVLDHLRENDILSNQQYGFLSGRSTSLQLLHVLDEWTQSLDDGKTLDVVYFDFKKAFDKVPHRRLFSKLRSYGIQGQTLNWITQFLTGRQQRVCVNGTTSSWNQVTSGVPQGSVLGPILFVIYINDLPEATTSPMFLFADDTKLYREIASQEDVETLQGDIQAMEDWSDTWRLEFHPQKCKVMSLSTRGTHPSDANYTMRGLGDDQATPIQRVEEEKDLGVITDCALSFDSHVSKVVTKANQISGIIRRSFTNLNTRTFRLLFKALVRPHLEYAQSAWQPYKIGQVTAIERVQRRATKKVNGLKNMSYPDRLKAIGLPTLAFRRHRGDMIELYKMTHGLYDQSLTRSIIQLQGNTRTRGHSLRLKKARCNRNTRLHFFSNRTINAWNSLTEVVATAPTLLTFEKRLDRHWAAHPLRTDYLHGTTMNAPYD